VNASGGRTDRFEYLLRLGDDALVAAQRLAEWVSRAPELEEDMALANIALDQLGQARLLLSYAGEVEGAGRSEDDLAYLRTDREYRNCLLVELPNGAPGEDTLDFGVTIAKLLGFSAYQHGLYQRLVASTDQRLAEIAGKAVKETAYHLDHAALWTCRLGDGTAESHRRMQAAVEQVWPYTHELFQADDLTARLAVDGSGVDPASLRDGWLSTVEKILAEATLTRPEDGWAPDGGRFGSHTEALSYLLGEMQSLHRAHPGVSW
jgi:ring-1,2-phenylacetyl-CoA epoxidase subunit PaaC